MAHQRDKRLTKREKQAMRGGPRPNIGGKQQAAQHIHCIACGRHLDPEEFEGNPARATVLQCQHKSSFASCVTCTALAQNLLDEHDRTGQPVKTAAAWH